MEFGRHRIYYLNQVRNVWSKTGYPANRGEREEAHFFRTLGEHMRGVVNEGLPKLPGYLSVTDIAEETGQHRTTIYYWINTGKLPAYEIGGIVVVDERDWARHRARRDFKAGRL